MLTLSQIVEKTELIFGRNVEVPVPPQLWHDKMLALEQADLKRQREALIFDMRNWQAQELGFDQINSSEMVEMIMGEKHTDSDDGPDRQNHEWVYDHHNDKLLGKTWGGKPTIFRRIEKTGLWHLPPFAKIEKWAVQFGKLDYLKRTIPYGVVLKVQECKALKLFNAFNVMAPMEAWERKTDIDPIVVGSIWELPLKDDGTPSEAGSVSHYFLAQW